MTTRYLIKVIQKEPRRLIRPGMQVWTGLSKVWDPLCGAWCTQERGLRTAVQELQQQLEAAQEAAEVARQGHDDEAARHTEARALIKVRIVDFLTQYVG